MTDANESTGKKRVRRDRTEEILQEAAKSFGIYGFRGTTLSSISKAVGLTEPGLLYYFPSKVHLLQSVLDYRDQQDKEKYKAILDQDNSALFDSMEDLVVGNEKIPGLIRLFTVLVGESIRKDHPSHDFFVDRYENTRKITAASLANYINTEDFDTKCDIDQLAALIIAVMDGLQIQWLLDPDNMSMSESFNLFSKIIVEYLSG
ncbi:MAG: TetR/AcrR family transcriptional regulator [Proteobacteria bacterium]|nr:TetR/AcrR family transcriptional regulator [Pseudomonadota bacterium]